MKAFLVGIWDGPVRNRAFWLTAFAAVVAAAAEFGLDLGAYQTAVVVFLDLLVLVGVLRATTATTVVDEVDRAWTLDSLAKVQAEREKAFERLSGAEIEGDENV